MRLSVRRPSLGLDAGSDIRRVAAGGTLNLLGGSFGALANLAGLVVVTRGLDKTSAGEYFAVTAGFLMAVAVSKLGSATGLVYFIAHFRAVGTRAAVRRSIRLGVLSAAAVGATLGIAVFVLAPRVAGLVGGDFDSRGVLFLRQVALLLPFAAVAEALQAATRGFGDMRTTVGIDRILRTTLQVGLLLVACAIGGRYAALAWALPYLPAALLSGWLLHRLWRSEAPPHREAEETVAPRARQYWRFSLPRAAADMLQVALQRVDIVLVAVMLGPAEAAVYAAATRFINLIGLSNDALTNALEPQVSALFAKRDKEGVMGLYQVTTGWLVALSWPICLVMLVFPRLVLSPFGSGYGSGALVVVPLAAAMLVSSGCGLVDLVLGMSGRTGWNLVNIAVALAVNIAVDLWLIPELGIRGAALGWAAAIVTANLLPIIEIHWMMRIHPFGRATFVAAALATGCYGLAATMARAVWGDTAVALMVALLLGTACYLPALWRLSAHLGHERPALPPSRATTPGDVLAPGELAAGS